MNRRRQTGNLWPEVVGVISTTAGLFLLVCLLTYSKRDPSFTSLGSDRVASNWGGLIGAIVADLLLQGFGLISFVAVAGLIGWGVRSFLNDRWAEAPRASESERDRGFLFALMSGVGVLSVSALVALVFDSRRIFDQSILIGGVLGFWIKTMLLTLFNFWGTLLLLVATLLVSALVLTPFSLHGLFDSIRHGVKLLRSQLSDSWDVRSLFRRKKALRSIPRPEVSVPAFEPLEVKIPTEPAPPIEPSVPPASEEPYVNPLRPSKHSHYTGPTETLLNVPTPVGLERVAEEAQHQAHRLQEKLKDYGIEGRVVGVHPGPIITCFEFEPVSGVKVKNIINLSDDLKMALRAMSVRIIAPIPGKGTVGIEIPNSHKQIVTIREILGSEHFRRRLSPLSLILGKTTSGDPFVADLRKMPHLLIAGATGSGKSVGINCMICSMIYKARPEELRFIMIDPKMLELSVYEGIPHLLLPVVTDPKRATKALRWVVAEMERRYRLISEVGARNIQSYNLKVDRLSTEELKLERKRARAAHSVLEDAEPELESETSYEKLPYIVVVIDELADLIMVSSKEVEELITRLAQMARAAGIHLIVATQRPSVDVITGLIKANFPARISFQVSSRVDSRTIIDTAGAESLLGDGDMLYLPPGTSRLQRIHGALVTEEEVERVVSFLKTQGGPDFDQEALTKILVEEAPADDSDFGDRPDPIYDEAVRAVLEMKHPSISLLQRRLRIGYNRAARLIEQMERENLISPPDPSRKGREVLSRPLE